MPRRSPGAAAALNEAGPRRRHLFADTLNEKKKDPRTYGTGDFADLECSFYDDAFPALDYSARNTSTLSHNE
jgi:hypothetical protein